MKKKWKLLLIIIWMILIFILSACNATESSYQSNIIVNFISRLFNIENIDMLTFIIRKLAHFIEYLILGILVSNYLIDYHKKIYLNIIICNIYSISDEIHQLFVDGRSCEIRDIIIDTLASITGIMLFYLSIKLIKGSTQKWIMKICYLIEH